MRVYFNLNRNTYSIQDQAHRVVDYADELCLLDVRFVVYEAGRKRVLREHQKNVHAFVEGVITNTEQFAPVPVSYNPYRSGTFCRDRLVPIYEASFCRCSLQSDGRPILWVSAGGLDLEVLKSQLEALKIATSRIIRVLDQDI